MQSSAVQMLVAARRVADYAKELGADLQRFEIRPAYDHMGALLADSILQAGLNYNSVVRPRILAILADYPGLSRISNLLELVERGETSAFLNWTHQVKVGRFDALVLFLADASIEHVDDLKEGLQDSGFAKALRGVRGVGPKTVDYMGCLVGMDSVAVDRHVRTFAKRVGVMEDDYDFLKTVFCYAADLLSVSRREFDAWVWQREALLTKRQMAFAF
ncbi:hypothetical protein G6M14_05555 [Agrobacterium tumefaciens]|uniref:hypothetical protein n=1 Tax=Agrobacterium tumefaciens TaxID=358 RepID=UPI001571D54C|nr:hypothetical protein [Agrobacterium tumefaciens]